MCREISSRRTDEKRLEDENSDLKELLAQAVRCQDELRCEVEQVQDRFCEVAELLTDARDELSMLKSGQM